MLMPAIIKVCILAFIVLLAVFTFYESSLVKTDLTSSIIEHHSPPTAVIEQGSGVEAASYIIFRDNDSPVNYYAKNGSTGAIEFKSTNASYVIQSAINQLTNGGKIFIRSGTYNISATLNINKPYVILEGENWNTILRLANNVNARVVILNSQYDELNTLQIDGNRANNAGFVTGILINASNSKVRNIYSHDSKVYGIGVGDADTYINNVLIENCLLANATNGLLFGYASNSIARNIWVTGNSDVGVSVYGGYSATAAVAAYQIILENIFAWDNNQNNSYWGINTHYAIDIERFSHDVTIKSPVIWGDNGGGIYLSDSTSKITIIDAHTSRSTTASSGDMLNTKANMTEVIGGLWTNNKEAYSVIFVEAPNFKMTGGTIRSGCSYTINTGAGGTDAQIVNVLFDGNGTSGTGISNGESGWRIVDSTFMNFNSGSGITQWGGSNGLIENNIFKGPINRGIHINNNADNNTILGNKFINGVTTGIYIGNANCDNTIIDENDLRGAVTPISNSGTNTIIRRNQGYVTENRGSASVSNGSTISHGLAATPTYASCIPTVANVTCSVTSVSSTQLTLGMFFTNGTAVSTAQTVYWYAEV